MKCLYPLTIRRTDGYLGRDGLTSVTVPCGKCAVCRKERSKMWASRLMLESLYFVDSVFVTLTYDDENLVRASRSTLPTLYKPDVQKFFKRLRKDLEGTDRKIKYYAVGEYGDRTFRPHYHCIIFGLSQKDKELISDNWSLGRVDVGDVTLASCNYVSGYIQKKLYGEVSGKVYYDRLPPFSLMSKGIGLDYLDDNIDDFKNGNAIKWHGKFLKTPRYFWKRLGDFDKTDFETSCKVRISKESKSRELAYQDLQDYARRGVVDLSLIDEIRLKERDNREARYKKIEEMYPAKGNF